MPNCWDAAGAWQAGYIDDVKHHHRHPLLVRIIVANVAHAAAAQAGGAPMCASLVAELAAPCAMHIHQAARPHNGDNATQSVVTSGHEACRADAATPGCLTGGACTSGTAAPVGARVPVAPRAASRTGVLGPVSALISYLAPPLSPPPQA